MDVRYLRIRNKLAVRVLLLDARRKPSVILQPSRINHLNSPWGEDNERNLMSSSTVISSPGKVLAAGGYLVLDPAYSGVVISTSSRFYAVIQSRGGANEIEVRSPQFISAVWNYSVGLDDGSITVKQIPGK